MTISVEYDQHNDCVIGSYVGVLDSTTIRGYAAEAHRVMSLHDCGRFLSDLRSAEPDLSTAQVYALPERLVELGIGRHWRRALVVSGNLEDFAFFEDVSVNRGYRVRVFNDLDEAMNWLHAR